jgi:SAM-dependent methyltransferase
LDLTCPLCAGAEIRPSWHGSLFFKGREFEYLECTRCLSLFCHPMPDAAVLVQMYGPDAEGEYDGSPDHVQCADPGRTLEHLRTLPRGRFIDFGCGGGGLLREARALGFEVLGIEYDAAIAERVRVRTGLDTTHYGSDWTLSNRSWADVLHLGDVLEHLTDINGQFAQILELLKPGGVLLVEGPLQANATLFNLCLRLARPLLRRLRKTEVAPQHVLLATLKGQKAFFARFGLREAHFALWEDPWPAPSTVSVSDIRRPRTLGLYALGQLSCGVSRLRAKQWGNRFFFVGYR